MTDERKVYIKIEGLDPLDDLIGDALRGPDATVRGDPSAGFFTDDTLTPEEVKRLRVQDRHNQDYPRRSPVAASTRPQVANLPRPALPSQSPFDSLPPELRLQQFGGYPTVNETFVFRGFNSQGPTTHAHPPPPPPQQHGSRQKGNINPHKRKLDDDVPTSVPKHPNTVCGKCGSTSHKARSCWHTDEHGFTDVCPRHNTTDHILTECPKLKPKDIEYYCGMRGGLPMLKLHGDPSTIPGLGETVFPLTPAWAKYNQSTEYTLVGRGPDGRLHQPDENPFSMADMVHPGLGVPTPQAPRGHPQPPPNPQSNAHLRDELHRIQHQLVDVLQRLEQTPPQPPHPQGGRGGHGGNQGGRGRGAGGYRGRGGNGGRYGGRGDGYGRRGYGY